MAEIITIPPELLALILAETPLKALLVSRRVCKRFRHVADNHTTKMVCGAPGIGVLQAVFECRKCRVVDGPVRVVAPLARDCKCNAVPLGGPGVFALIANDGKQDRMLMATTLLNQRLLEIERLRNGGANPPANEPVLAEAERCNVLFMNAHFKPFANIGYEYAEKTPAVALGGKVQFAIPRYGDFIQDMTIRIELPPVDNTDYLLPLWMFGDNNPTLRLSRRQQRRLRRRQRRLGILNAAA